MHIHFIGVGGTLMGHLAVLAKQSGHVVSGSDEAVYAPMDGVLRRWGIDVIEGWNVGLLKAKQVDLFVLGNAGLKRGHPAVEHVLGLGVRFMSGAEWFGKSLLAERWVLAVAGTHGKTTASAMLAWILQEAGLEPGYLVAGVMQNMDESARLGAAPFFVVEADEYDTSYFDRQAKFLHYRPRTLVIGNLEYDHADIYSDLAAIQAQFHLLLRRLPQDGLLVTPAGSENVETLIKSGCWSERQTFGWRGGGDGGAGGDVSQADWQAEHTASGFTLYQSEREIGQVEWHLLGTHNVENALAAVIAARHAGVTPEQSLEALGSFQGVKRRLEKIGCWGKLTLYDDFAHHPTAIKTTLDGMRQALPKQRIIAFIDPHSHTMARGDLFSRFAESTVSADLAVWWQNERLQWAASDLVNQAPKRIEASTDLNSLAKRAASWVSGPKPVHLVCMSNQSFQGIVSKIAALCAEAAASSAGGDDPAQATT